jgi:hypothetical protein
MKLFRRNEIFEAYAHAAKGGQALHVCSGAFARYAPGGRSPARPFRNVKVFAHLIDNDIARLKATAQRLGVRVIKVDREGVQGQHIEPVRPPTRAGSRPLERAMEITEGRTLFAECVKKIGPYNLNEIYEGDARELAQSIPDASVDLIFTDPPYKKEFIPLYGWLCNEAMRVLKPGGFVCFIAASLYLDEIFALARGSGLTYYFKVESLNRFDAPVIWPRKILNRSKPILMYTKGAGTIVVPNMSSVYSGQGPDKRFHAWGQDEGSARFIISYCLGDDEHDKYKAIRPAVLWEPFAGGGATLQACKALGVDYLAFELDPAAVEVSRARMNGFIPEINGQMQLTL